MKFLCDARQLENCKDQNFTSKTRELEFHAVEAKQKIGSGVKAKKEEEMRINKDDHFRGRKKKNCG